MNRAHAFCLGFLVLLSCILNVKLNLVGVEASDGYPVHNLDTGLNYTTIQEAIDASETLNGNTIKVDAGTYFEHVTIAKSVCLIGENVETAIIDGNGTGTVVQIAANNITVANLTIRNGGHQASWTQSCIYGEFCSDILIENNTIMNASCGIIFYGFSSSTMRNNSVKECGNVGLHIDGDSNNCTILDNTVVDSLEGIDIEGSSENRVEGNLVSGNNASVVLNSCSGLNVFRNNNMTSDWYNLIVWGSTLEAFVQDIDSSNTANGKIVYYIINSDDLVVDPSGYPNMGCLGIVNCSNVTIKDADLSFNKDGLLLAQSSDCYVTNVTISGNRGPLIYGGLTFAKTNSSVVVGCRITNNNAGICLQQSDGNCFYHNSFIDVDWPAVTDFYSPFLLPSGAHSTAKWDDGIEGNYWSNCTAADSDHDGIGDAEYIIDPNNTDRHPLMGSFSSFSTLTGKSVEVISNSTIDYFKFCLANSTIRIQVSNMTSTQASGFCRICIPKEAMNVDSLSVILDGGNTSVLYADYNVLDNGTHRWIYFAYEHLTREIDITPEFSSFLILSLFIATPLPITIAYKRKRPSSSEGHR